MKPWGWPEDGVNPYRRTLFQVLDLDPAEKGKAAVKYRITQRRNRIRSAPERHLLFGRRLSEAEVNQAEAALADPVARLYAELCTHRREGRPPGPAVPCEPPEPPRPLDVLDLTPARLAALLPAAHEYTPPPPPQWWKEPDDATP